MEADDLHRNWASKILRVIFEKMLIQEAQYVRPRGLVALHYPCNGALDATADIIAEFHTDVEAVMKKEHEEMLKGLELGKGGHLGPRIIETMEKVNKKDKPEERLEVLFDDLLEDALEIAKEPDVEVRVQAVKDMMANKKAWTRTPFYKN